MREPDGLPVARTVFRGQLNGGSFMISLTNRPRVEFEDRYRIFY